MKRLFLGLTAVGAACALTACSTDSGVGPGASADGNADGSGESLSIFATTGYLADAAKNIAPEADVFTMVGPGGDPHTYQPSTKDIEKMQDADLVLWNGLHLEAQMITQLESLGDKQLAVGDRLDTADLLTWPEEGAGGEQLYDPHIWNSPELWSQVVDLIGDKLADVDADNAETFSANADSYREEIDAAAQQSDEILADVPTRTLITGHDAFNYFGKTFGFEVHATDFVSTEAEKSPREISQLADVIAQEEVPVIFHDNQANPQAITSLSEAVESRGWTVEVSDEELFADTLGPTEPTDTYLGAFKHNAEAVAEGLSK